MDIHAPDNTRSAVGGHLDLSCTRNRVTALLTSYNRKVNTLECLARLELAARHACVSLDAVLVDDASTDGTAAAVTAAFPWVTLERGDGSLFWNRGMYQAQATAMQRGADYLLWINDDTLLVENALSNLLDTLGTLRLRLSQTVIVVGSTADRATGRLTYGGSVSPNRLHRFTYSKVWSATKPVECEVMNGNLVLIPLKIAQAVGNLDPVFEHAMGDTDYALRIRAKGFRIFVAPGFVGHCSNNTISGTYRDATLPLSVRWKKMMSRKGLPPRSWGHFTRRHGGPAWPIYFVWPYIKLIAGEVRRIKRSLSRQR